MTEHLTTPVSDANQGRRGRPFSMRLSEEERQALNVKAAEARRHMPYEYGNGRLHGSVAHFLIWAAMNWKAPEPEKPEPNPKLDRALAKAYGIKRRRPPKAKRGSTGGRRRPPKRSGKRPAKRSGKGGRK